MKNDGSKELQDARDRARNQQPSWAMSKDGPGALVKDAADEPGEDAVETKRRTLIRLGVDVPNGASPDWIEGAYAQAVGEK
jgi:hypothetical protein